MSIGWTNNFDPADQYRMVLFPPGHLVVDRDENEAQQILDYYLRKAVKELNGMGKVIQNEVGSPVVNVKESGANRPTGGIYEIKFVTITAIKWRLNGGAWLDNGGSGYTVTADGETWNYDVGGSGLDVVFNTGVSIADSAELSAQEAMRYSGCRLNDSGSDSVILRKGVLYVDGYRITIDSDVQKNVAVGETRYLYVDMYTQEVEYTTDSGIGHQLPDSSYFEPCPGRLQVETVWHCESSLPTAETGHVKYVVAKVANSGGVLTIVDYMDDADFHLRLPGAGTYQAPVRPVNLMVYTNTVNTDNRMRAGSNVKNANISSRMSLRTGRGIHRPYLRVEWGKNGMGGSMSVSPDADGNRVFVTGVAMIENEWVGQYLWFEGYAEYEHLIVSNTAGGDLHIVPIVGYNYNGDHSGNYRISPLGINEGRYVVEYEAVQVPNTLSPTNTGDFPIGGRNGTAIPICPPIMLEGGVIPFGDVIMREATVSGTDFVDNAALLVGGLIYHGSGYQVRVRADRWDGSTYVEGTWSIWKIVVAGMSGIGEIGVSEIGVEDRGDAAVRFFWTETPGAIGYQIALVRGEGTVPNFGDTQNVELRDLWVNTFFDVAGEPGEIVTIAVAPVDANGNVPSEPATRTYQFAEDIPQYAVPGCSIPFTFKKGVDPDIKTILLDVPPYDIIVNQLNVYVQVFDNATQCAYVYVLPKDSTDALNVIYTTVNKSNEGGVAHSLGKVWAGMGTPLHIYIDGTLLGVGDNFNGVVTYWFRRKMRNDIRTGGSINVMG